MLGTLRFAQPTNCALPNLPADGLRERWRLAGIF
jgi:hypothetical protein